LRVTPWRSLDPLRLAGPSSITLASARPIAARPPLPRADPRLSVA